MPSFFIFKNILGKFLFNNLVNTEQFIAGIVIN